MPEQARRACRWWEPHNWGAWSEPKPGIKTHVQTVNVAHCVLQQRTCNRCGLVFLREVTNNV
jgi:hypothetical protein